MGGVAATTQGTRSLASEPGGNSIAWRPSHELDLREWAVAGRRIGSVGRRIQWLLGDWISYGSSRFGEKYARAAQITGYDTQSLMNMVYVASRFPISRRRENLSWSHHEAVTSLEDVDQEHWLDQAVEHKWSVSDLRMMLRVARRQKDRELETVNGTIHGSPMSVQGAHRFAGEQAPDLASEAIDDVDAVDAATVMCPRCGEEIKVVSGSV